MICLKSPKSSEFAIFFNSGQKSLTKFISSYCNNYLIEFFENREINKYQVMPLMGFEPAYPGFEATEHLRNRNRMHKENCRKRLLINNLMHLILNTHTINLFTV